jgi:hypothetical protein
MMSARLVQINRFSMERWFSQSENTLRKPSLQREPGVDNQGAAPDGGNNEHMNH